MPRILPLLLGAALVAGCAGEHPRSAASYPPPPQNGAPPASAYRPATPRVVSGPRPVKPIGAGVLAANTVEGYMDGQEKELRVALRGAGIVVARTGNTMLLNIRNDLVFERDSAKFSPRGSELLERIAMIVRKYDSSLVVVNAFTDTTGTHDQNLAVSQNRADAVVKQLQGDGVDQRRLSARGFGDEILKIPTGPNVNEPRNRRIEMKISPVMNT